MAGLGKDIRVDGQNYAEAKVLPKNTTSYSDSLEVGKGGQNASVNVKGVVDTKIVMAQNKKVTIKLQDSDTNVTEDYADKFTIKEITSPADEAYSIPIGTVLFNSVLAPDTKKYTRIALTSDDAGLEGKIDIYPQYVPR